VLAGAVRRPAGAPGPSLRRAPDPDGPAPRVEPEGAGRSWLDQHAGCRVGPFCVQHLGAGGLTAAVVSVPEEPLAVGDGDLLDLARDRAQLPDVGVSDDR